ncbi:hypothetical protein [Gallionella capsiferriformans]|uniref:hypothetical protein n=1 Tax=Gallionella capsiferriformans TaxID=370405 RepID=UPI0001AB1F75|nr:hypothetical protein [Gallionella capsiferriformans]
MSYHGVLGAHAIAISTSESPDMPVLGLSNEHLRDAMAEIARHMLALGAHLVYGGDLRAHGFSELLFELVARHYRDADEGGNRTGVVNYLAWPVHIRMDVADIAKASSDLSGAAELVCLTIEGVRQTTEERRLLEQQEPTDDEWSAGLTTMRHVILSQSHARIVLGGRVDQYKGVMPGIAEEALLSLKARQPLFLLGGFGGCARDIAEMLGIIEPWAVSRSGWPGRNEFKNFTVADLNNGLTREENMTLARTPHIDQSIALIMRGLLNSSGTGA